MERFVIRDKSPDRHRGHVINTQYPEVEGQESMSIESQAISPTQYFSAMTQRGMMNFSIGGEEILVDTTDFSKISYEKIYEEVKKKIPNSQINLYNDPCPEI